MATNPSLRTLYHIIVALRSASKQRTLRRLVAGFELLNSLRNNKKHRVVDSGDGATNPSLRSLSNLSHSFAQRKQATDASASRCGVRAYEFSSKQEKHRVADSGDGAANPSLRGLLDISRCLHSASKQRTLRRLVAGLEPIDSLRKK